MKAVAQDVVELARRRGPGVVRLNVAEQAGVDALQTVSVATIALLFEELDVGPTPIRLPFDWGTLAGVDSAEVPRTKLTLAPPAGGHAYRGMSLGTLPSRIEGGSLLVDVPAGRRIRSLHIADLETDEAGPAALRNQGDLDGRRLTVSADTDGTGFGAPVVSVPAVGASGQIPASLTGGAFGARLLDIPDVAGRRLRISLVSGGTPDEFESEPITAGVVTGWAAPIPRELTVKGPDGAVLWSFPDEFLPGSGASECDLTVGLQGAIDAMLAEGARVQGEVTISARDAARVFLAKPAIRGSFLRKVPGTLRSDLEGGPVTMPIPDDPLPATVPTSATADVHVSYMGIRIAELSDLLPDGRAVEGVVVGSEAVERALPPAALRGERIARVGIVGRALEPCKLTIQLVTPEATDAEPLSSSVVAVTPAAASAEVEVVWVELDPPVEITSPFGVAVTATEGRFLWVADPEPSVRLAVVDPDPGGRPILLGGSTLVTLDRPTLAVPRASLPIEPMAESDGGLVLASALYCSVELTDLELRWSRPGAV